MRENVSTKARRLLASDSVQIKFATDHIVSAAVRGDSGIYDIRWSRDQGWDCTCAAFGQKCSHIEATRSVTMRSVNA
jgi:hypothetical protein